MKSRWHLKCSLLTAILFSFIAIGCNLATGGNSPMGDTYSMYEHKESMEFFETGEFERANLAEYRVDQVLIAVAIGQHPNDNNDNYFLWVNFYSPEKTNYAVLQSVSFFKNDKIIKNDLGTKIDFKSMFKGLNVTKVKVFDDIDEAFLEEGTGDLELLIEFNINSKKYVKRFAIEQKKFLVPIH